LGWRFLQGSKNCIGQSEVLPYVETPLAANPHPLEVEPGVGLRMMYGSSGEGATRGHLIHCHGDYLVCPKSLFLGAGVDLSGLHSVSPTEGLGVGKIILCPGDSPRLDQRSKLKIDSVHVRVPSGIVTESTV
jgi:hypothetical protein